jgi:hypothetical protein
MDTGGANRVKILFTTVGSEGDLTGSPNSLHIHTSLRMHEGLLLPLRRMVAHQIAIQRVRSASLPKFVKETLARFAGGGGGSVAAVAEVAVEAVSVPFGFRPRLLASIPVSGPAILLIFVSRSIGRLRWYLRHHKGRVGMLAAAMSRTASARQLSTWHDLWT